MDKKDATAFKAKLLTTGISQKDFCIDRGINYSMFNQQINGFCTMTDNNKMAVTEFMKDGADHE